MAPEIRITTQTRQLKINKHPPIPPAQILIGETIPRFHLKQFRIRNKMLNRPARGLLTLIPLANLNGVTPRHMIE